MSATTTVSFFSWFSADSIFRRLSGDTADIMSADRDPFIHRRHVRAGGKTETRERAQRRARAPGTRDFSSRKLVQKKEWIHGGEPLVTTMKVISQLLLQIQFITHDRLRYLSRYYITNLQWKKLAAVLCKSRLHNTDTLYIVLHSQFYLL